MDTILILSPEKLREARGERTLEEIARASKYVFRPQQIHAYEQGQYRPRPEKIPALLRALGVSFDRVAEPVEDDASRAA